MATATLASPDVPLRCGEIDDGELIARVRAGDDAAFAALYRRYHRRVAAYIYGMVKDFGRAEDIAQDVFMSALRRMRETDRDIAFKPWIYEIAKNACIDQFRRSRRAEEVSYDAEDALGAADQRRLVSVGPTPDAAVAQKLTLDDLRGAFGGLSDIHREILVMREFEGLSYAEIGARLNLTRPAVESTLFRARKRLAEEYEELVSGTRCLRVQSIVEVAQTSSLGTRDRRRLAAHVSHCQPCRRHAVLAAIDPALLRTPPRVRTKIAALLPLPLFLRRRLEDTDPTVAVSSSSVHVAQWSAQLSAFSDPSVAVHWARAAVAAATIAAAGIGAGVATDMVTRDGGSPPPKQVAAAVAGGSVWGAPVPASAASRRAEPRSVLRASTASGSPASGKLQRGGGGQSATDSASLTGSAPPTAATPSAPGGPGRGNRGTGIAKKVKQAVPGVSSPHAPAMVRHPKRWLRRTAERVVNNATRTIAPVLADTKRAVDDASKTVDGLIPGG